MLGEASLYTVLALHMCASVYVSMFVRAQTVYFCELHCDSSRATPVLSHVHMDTYVQSKGQMRALCYAREPYD